MIHSNNRSNNLKSDVDSLNIGNLETTPVYLIKLSNVLKKIKIYFTNELKKLMALMLLIVVI